MADQKLTERTPTITSKDDDYLHVVQSGISNKIKRKDLVKSDGIVINDINDFYMAITNGTIGLWTILSDITLTIDKTLPTGVTLKFINAKINLDGFNLTGTNTKIEAGLSQIFDTTGTLIGFNVKEVYPEWFGAKCDGIIDDTNSIQSSLNFSENRILTFQKDKNIIANSSTLIIPSNITIKANNSTLISKIIPASLGNKPLTIFNIDTKSNVYIHDLILDQNEQSEAIEAVTLASDIANSITIKSSTNINFYNCELKNTRGNWIALSDVDFSAIGIKDSENITFNNFMLREFFVEGCVFKDTNKIRLIEFKTDSIASGWTPLHFWYCDGIYSENINMNNNVAGGSSINSAMRNAYFKNTIIKNGKGIQISNELNEKSYKSENITFDGGNLDTYAFSIARIDNSNWVEAENITIKDLKIRLTDDTGSSANNTAIRMDKAKDIFIENINFDIPDLNSFAFNFAGDENININSCTGLINAFMRVSLDNESVKNLTVENCKLDFLTNSGATYTDGRGVFLYATHETASTATLAELNNVKFLNNIINGIEGGIAYCRFNEFTKVQLNNIEFSNNYFYPTSTTKIGTGFNVRSIKELKIIDNFITGADRQYITSVENLILKRNIVEYLTTYQNTAAVWQINTCSGFADIQFNEAINRNTGVNHFFSNSANTFTSYLFMNNKDQNSSGILNTASGTTAQRPTATFVNQIYYDSTLGKNIWWNGTVWKDATGTSV